MLGWRPSPFTSCPPAHPHAEQDLFLLGQPLTDVLWAEHFSGTWKPDWSVSFEAEELARQGEKELIRD